MHKAVTRVGVVAAWMVAINSMACAGEHESSAANAAQQTVDLRAVVAAGTVSPVDGVTSSGQPNAEALQVFADAGYAAVIDLRAAGEARGIDEREVVETLGMSYVNLPVAGANGISFENAERLDQLLAEIDGPVLMHCGSGNRVGALMALRASLNGADDDAAIAAGKAAGLTRAETAVRQLLEADAD